MTKRCSKCDVLLESNAEFPFCRKCLMAVGLENDSYPKSKYSDFADDLTKRPRSNFVAPSVAELAAKFPQLEILELLGVGGMGAVYKVRQLRLDRWVALKIIRPESSQDTAFAARFSREAKTLAKMNHPHIVGVYDFGELTFESSTLYYFLMEYVEGTDLRRLLHGGKLSPQQALAIVPQICDALQYAHHEGVVHRDIKPENILVDIRGKVKIADFGIAKLTKVEGDENSLTGTHQIMGTPRYMAPEQMDSSHRVDGQDWRLGF